MPQEHSQYEQNVLKYFSGLHPEGFETSHCIFTHSEPPNEITLFKKGTMEVVRCECGFVYNKRQPTKISLDDFYSHSDAMNSWVDLKKTDHEDLRQREKFLPTITYLAGQRIKSLLDIGCGQGKFLSLLKEMLPNVAAMGLDQNASSVKESSFPILNQSLEDFLRNNQTKFEAVSLWGVLEHVKNPIGLLREIRNILTYPGLVVICVPNVESAVVTTLWEKCFTFCPQHLWYFSKQTLEKALNEAGFSSVSLNTIETEALPLQKHANGLDPYRQYPNWVNDRLLSKSQRTIMDLNILIKQTGYKIVSIAR